MGLLWLDSSDVAIVDAVIAATDGHVQRFGRRTKERTSCRVKLCGSFRRDFGSTQGSADIDSFPRRQCVLNPCERLGGGFHRVVSGCVVG